MSVDIARLKVHLEAKAMQLEERLLHIQRDQGKAYSADSEERAQERENDEVIDGIGAETKADLASVRAALERINDGTYGICGACGEPIAQERLAARPEASRCIDCAA
tara:strand:- start:55 stop:375 length:321 start_codon:yes stop_codon:yes gene_type:complete